MHLMHPWNKKWRISFGLHKNTAESRADNETRAVSSSYMGDYRAHKTAL